MRNLLAKTQKHQGNQYAGKDLSILPDDIFLVSYPKSGNTWLRFLIANLICHSSTNVSFKNIEKLVPDIYRNSDKSLLSIPRPRVLKSHEMYQPQYPKVIYILRDPRDVAVSYYHHLIKANRIPESMPIRDFIDKFIAGKFHPKFGTWQAHVMSWTSTDPSTEAYLIVKYEKLLEDTQSEMEKIAGFLDFQTTCEAVKMAIENSQADRLRQLEIKEKWQPFEGEMRMDKRFVRAATSGNWKHELPSESIQKIESAWGGVMEKHGYSIT